MGRNRFAAAALLLLAVGCVSEPSPTDGSGGVPTGNAQNWSDPNTWPTGLVPVAGDSVVIPAGEVVRLDVSPPSLQSLTILGTLVFANTDLSLTSGWIVVQGALQIGTESSPYTKRAIITLTGTGSSTNPDVYGMGNKVLGVTGRIELHGSGRKGWTRLSQTAAVGATSIELASSMSWKAGDRLVLASSDYSPDKAEEVVIASVSGRTVTLTSGLKYEHYGQVLTVSGVQVDERAEVGLLSRNITIQGDTGSTPGYGGHMIIMGGATAHIEGIELFQMGQRGNLARYPMHWHMAGDVSGQYFRNNSVWRTFNRCVTVHGSDNSVVQDNVCYDHTGHGYFMEDGAETGNLIEGNLGLSSRVPQGTDRLLGSDSRPATFWITNPDNTIRNNVAAGSKGFGFWCAFPASPTGLSVGQPDLPRTTPLREFNGNVAHSNNSGALNVDDGPMLDGNTQTTNYTPRANPAAKLRSGHGGFHEFPGLQAFRAGGMAPGPQSQALQFAAGRQRHRGDLRRQRNLRDQHDLHRPIRIDDPTAVELGAARLRVLRREGLGGQREVHQLHRGDHGPGQRPGLQSEQRLPDQSRQLRRLDDLHQCQRGVPGGCPRRQGWGQGGRLL